MKNKTKKALCAASILGVVAISGIFAYLTDTDSKTNYFTVGDVEIELLEPSWDDATDTDDNGVPDFAENIVPNQVIAKDPQVANTGSNPAYVYLKVNVPKVTESIAGADGTLTNDGKEDTVQLFTYTVNSEWTLLSSDDSDTDYNEYVYYYNTALTNDTTENANITTPLFNQVQVANVAFNLDAYYDDNYEMDYDIAIEAYAIQSNGLPQGTSIADAYSLITTQENTRYSAPEVL